MANTAKKNLLLVALSFIFIINGHAKQRTEAEASSIAYSFYSNSSTLRNASGDLKLVYTGTDGAAATRLANGNIYYYVFNKGDGGFVIVSGDDRARSILGYSNEGAFDIASAPDNFKYWLNTYGEEIKFLLGQPESTGELAGLNEKTEKNASAVTAVGPLLGNIKWGQDNPYNLLCPKTHRGVQTVSGCVATGMAQVMKYYNWPERGVGANSYTPDSVKNVISVDFSKTTYDWANMTPTYGSASTQAQKDAVATLMYHCGVAVNMQYDSSANGGSAATVYDMGQGMVKYFNYDAGMQLYDRDYYTRNEWADMLKAELNAARPVLYSGRSTDAGHLFVCDGYDSNNLFHMNWGWNGSSNGYFELSALNPASLGIGGGTAGGFNVGQTITVRIQKPTASSKKNYVICAEKYDLPANTTRNSKFTLVLNKCFNRGLFEIPGLQFRAELRNANNEFVAELQKLTAGNLASRYGWNKCSMTDITIPTSVSNGTYKLYITFMAAGQTEFWAPRLKTGTAQCVNVTVTSTNLTFSEPADNKPSLDLVSLTTIGNLYKDKTGRFTTTVSNTGTGDYNSYLCLYLISTTSSTNKKIISQDPVVIAAGETKTFNLLGDINLNAGNYNLYTMYDPANDRDKVETVNSFGNPIPVTVLATPTQDPALTVTSPLTTANASAVDKENAVFTARIKNTGGYFEEDIIAFVFPPTGGTSLTYLGYQKLMLDKNEEVLVTFAGGIDLDAGQYFLSLRYWTSSWTAFTPSSYAQLPFRLVERSVGITGNYVEHQGLYPNPANEVLYLKSGNAVSSIRIIDLSGKQQFAMQPNAAGTITIPINNLASGTYILQSVTDEGATNYKFIKK